MTRPLAARRGSTSQRFPDDRVATASGVQFTRSSDAHVIEIDPSFDRRLLLSIVEAAECLGISRAHFYEMIARGEIATVRLGRRRMVRSSDLSAYVTQLDVAPLF